MSTNKKYYWMKLKENFFESEEIVLLESMQDGFMYSNILLKMYLKSLKTDGRLVLKERIPYNANMIATLTRHQVGTVEKALDIFKQLGLIEILDNQAIYMMDIQMMIGEGSSEADRKKAYRDKIKSEKLMIEGGQMSAHSSPEIEKELELEKEKDIYIENDDRIDWFSECYLGYTGAKYRKVKKNINWNAMLEDTSKEEFVELVYAFFEDSNTTDNQMTIEYFNTVVDRYR